MPDINLIVEFLYGNTCGNSYCIEKGIKKVEPRVGYKFKIKENAMKTRILICDDDEDMVNLISKMLVKNNYDVDEITQMVDFMDNVQEFEPDMILMDISMPDINGVDATRMLYNHDSTSHIPVIFMSADPNIEEYATQLNKLYIKKPFDIDRLQAILSLYSI